MQTFEEISLSCPYRNWGEDKSYERLLMAYVEMMRELVRKLKAGDEIFVKVKVENYEGSIARLSVKNQSFWKTKAGNLARDAESWKLDTFIEHFNPVLTWDGAKNKIHPSYYDLIWLKGYTGPTILNKFDKKKAKGELLNNKEFKDIDGNTLKVGDEVLYINARYGGGMRLCRGKIVRFDAKVNSGRSETFTIVAGPDGEESKISDSSQFTSIIKK